MRYAGTPETNRLHPVFDPPDEEKVTRCRNRACILWHDIDDGICLSTTCIREPPYVANASREVRGASPRTSPPPCSASDGVWWCNSHQRQATHTDAKGRHCCNPKLGGILLPCNVVFAPMSIGPDEPNNGVTGVTTAGRNVP